MYVPRDHDSFEEARNTIDETKANDLECKATALAKRNAEVLKRLTAMIARNPLRGLYFDQLRREAEMNMLLYQRNYALAASRGLVVSIQPKGITWLS